MKFKSFVAIVSTLFAANGMLGAAEAAPAKTPAKPKVLVAYFSRTSLADGCCPF